MLFEENPSILIDTNQSRLILHRNFLTRNETKLLFDKLINLNFDSEEYIYNGRSIKSLKKSTALGSQEFIYTYSGIHRKAIIWDKYPEIIKLSVKISNYVTNKLSTLSHNLFNFVLCNLYNNGKAGVGWHSDDESIINQNIPIASISFGESRIFEIAKCDKNTTLKTALESSFPLFQAISLNDGDLLIMEGNFQNDFLHRIKKDSSKNPRINLTFRNLKRE